MLYPAIILGMQDERFRTFMLALYEKYHMMMLRCAWQILKNESDAEDAVSDALLCLIDKAELLSTMEDKAQRSYIHITTRNAALQIVRRRRGVSELLLDMDEFSGKTEQNRTPEQEAIRRYDLVQLEAAMERLPQEGRDILWLKYYMGMSDREIAGQTGLSETAVRSRMTRLRKRVYDLMQEAEGGMYHPEHGAGARQSLHADGKNHRERNKKTKATHADG